jgi:chorismate mutase
MTKRAVLETYRDFLDRIAEEILDIVAERAGDGLAGRAVRRSAGVVTDRIQEEMHDQGQVLVEYTAAQVRGEENLASYRREFLEMNPVYARYDGDREAELEAHLLEHFDEAAADLEPLVSSRTDDFWTALTGSTPAKRPRHSSTGTSRRRRRSNSTATGYSPPGASATWSSAFSRAASGGSGSHSTTNWTARTATRDRPHPTSLGLMTSLLEGGALVWFSPPVDATWRLVRPACRTPFGVTPVGAGLLRPVLRDTCGRTALHDSSMESCTTLVEAHVGFLSGLLAPFGRSLRPEGPA